MQKKEELKTMKIWKKNLKFKILKSKESISELFNDNNEIIDIRRILNRLTDILRKKDRIKKNIVSMIEMILIIME